MNNIQMKRAVSMNGWCFAGDERTIQTSLQKLIEKGLEVQLTDADGVLVCKLEISLIQDNSHFPCLGFKVANLVGDSVIESIRLERDGKLLFPEMTGS